MALAKRNSCPPLSGEREGFFDVALAGPKTGTHFSGERKGFFDVALA